MPAAEVEAGGSLIEADPLDAPKGSFGKKVCGCCCLFIVLLLAVLNFLVYPLLSNLAASEFLAVNDWQVKRRTGDGYDISNLTYKMGWPLCPDWEEGPRFARFDAGCGEECFSPDLPKAMQAVFEQSLARRVSYTSRVEEGIQTIELSGWWIPAEGNAAEAPRIVYQHGFKGNSNGLGGLLNTYYLHRLGYSVLINNFRDHGYSASSERKTQEWGDAYPYDVLGAWDYLVNDPDGTLGGPLPPSKVGLRGNSLGGFTVLNAFGLEGRIPAASVDSPPYTPKGVFTEGVSRIAGDMGLGWAIPPVTPWLQNWLYADLLALAASRGIDLEKNLPQKNLPMGPPDRRPLFITTNPQDAVVPVSEYHLTLALLADHPDKYNVTDFYTYETCPPGSNAGAHTLGLLLETDLYTRMSCNFWKNAFGEDASSCGGEAARLNFI